MAKGGFYRKEHLWIELGFGVACLRVGEGLVLLIGNAWLITIDFC